MFFSHSQKKRTAITFLSAAAAIAIVCIHFDNFSEMEQNKTMLNKNKCDIDISNNRYDVYRKIKYTYADIK